MTTVTTLAPPRDTRLDTTPDKVQPQCRHRRRVTDMRVGRCPITRHT